MQSLANPIQTFAVGQFDVPALWAAPLSGLTDIAFRILLREFGAPYVVSEMIASEAVLRQVRDSEKIPDFDNEAAPCVVQLAGTDPDVMAEAASCLEGKGADIIDLNFGCPAKMVTKKAAGSALMRDLDHCRLILKAVRNATSLPLTIKMRLGWDWESVNAPQLAMMAEDIGFEAIVVHGRTRCDFYEGEAHWPAVTSVVEAVSLPVLVNGDISDHANLRTALDQSGAVGAMIGRGLIGKPWLIAEMLDGKSTSGDGSPAQASRAQASLAQTAALRHLDLAEQHFGSRGLRRIRKHLYGYAQQCPDPEALCALINETTCFEQMREHVAVAFSQKLLRAA